MNNTEKNNHATHTQDTGESYGADRLRQLGLTAKDGFRLDEGGADYQSGTDADGKPIYSKTNSGGIAIRFHRLDGEPVTYTTPRFRQLAANRRSIGSDIEPKHFYERIRLTPQDERAAGRKYSSPSNKETDDIGNIAFLPLQVRQAHQAAQQVQNLTITEGEIKAAVAAKHYGIPTIAFSGISVFRLTNEVRQLLKTTIPQTVTVLYDSDAIRNNGTDGEYLRRHHFFTSFVKVARELFDFQTETGQLFDVVLCIPTSTGGKGLDDILLSEQEAAAAYKSGINSRFFTFYRVCVNSFVSVAETVFSVYREYYKHIEGRILAGKPGEKLAHVFERYGISDISNKAICTPTGGGKTYLVNQFAESGNRVIIAVPTLALANNIAQEYGMSIFTGAQKEDISGAGKIVTTFSSLTSVCNIVSPAFYHLVIDESQNTGAGFMYSTMIKLVKLLPKFRSVTTLSGTPIPEFIPELSALERVTITTTKPEKQFYRYFSENILKAGVMAVKNSIQRGRFPIVLLNDTNAGGKLGAFEALLKANEITNYATFNSYKKQDTDFLSVTQCGHIPEKIKAIVTTTVLKEGNNIYNAYAYDYIILGNFHTNDIEQISNRSRRATDTAVYWIRPEKTESSEIKINSYRLASYYKEAATHAISELNLQATTEPEAVIIAEAHARRAIGSLPIKHNESGKYEIDFLRLNSMVIEAEKNALCKNENWYFERLGLFGFKINSTTEAEAIQASTLKSQKPTEAEAEAIAQEKEQAKVKQEKEVQTVLNDLAMLGAERAEAIAQEKRENLSKTEQKIYKYFVNLSQYCTEQQAIEHLKQTGCSQSKFTAIYNRLLIQYLKKENYYQNLSGFAIVLNAIYGMFQTGKGYAPGELKNILLDCLKLDKGLNLYKYKADEKRIDQTLKTIKYFFDVSKKSERKEGEKTDSYFLSEINLNALFGLHECNVNAPEPSPQHHICNASFQISIFSAYNPPSASEPVHFVR